MKRILAVVLAALTTLAQAQTLVRPFQGGTGIQNSNLATITRSGNHPLTITTTGTAGLTIGTGGTIAFAGGVVAAPAGSLTGATLASGVTASSLTSLGTIAALVAGTGAFSGNTSVGGHLSVTGSYATDAASRFLRTYRVGSGPGGEDVGTDIVQGPDTSNNAGWRVISTRSNGSNVIEFISATKAGAVSIPVTLGIAGGIITVGANGLYESFTNAVGELSLNYVGYLGGTTQFRNAILYDGKNAPVITVVGSTKAVTFAGTLGVTGVATFNGSGGVAEQAIFNNTSGGSIRLADTNASGSARDWIFGGRTTDFATMGLLVTTTKGGNSTTLIQDWNATGSRVLGTLGVTGVTTIGTTAATGAFVVDGTTGGGGGYTQWSTNGSPRTQIGSPLALTGSGLGTDSMYLSLGDIYLRPGNTNTVQLISTSTTFLTPVTLKGYTVGALPAGVVGMFVYVSDQLTTCAVPGAPLTGGGALKCPAFYNGTAWVGG